MYIILKVELNKYQTMNEKKQAQAINSAAFRRQIYTIRKEGIIIWIFVNNFDISDKAAFEKVRSYQEKNHTSIMSLCSACMCLAE